MLSLRARPQPEPVGFDRAPVQRESDALPPPAARPQPTTSLRHRRRALRAAWTPSMLRRLVRHRKLRLVAGVLAVGLAVGAISAERTALREQRAAWDTRVTAVEVVRFVPAGGAIGEAVRVVERPAAVVPDTALDAVPLDALAAVDLVPGELVLSQRVRRPGDGLLPLGTVAITVELDNEAPLVRPDALVDVWATDAANFSSRRIVRSAIVLRIDDRILTVAIPEGTASEVAVASLRPLTVTVVG